MDFIIFLLFCGIPVLLVGIIVLKYKNNRLVADYDLKDEYIKMKIGVKHKPKIKAMLIVGIIAAAIGGILAMVNLLDFIWYILHTFGFVLSHSVSIHWSNSFHPHRHP